MYALVDDAMFGFVLWLDRKPADYHVGFMRDGYVPPARHMLGHNDKTLWRDNDSDPWRLTSFLPLVDQSDAGQLFLFSTSTQGGKDAFANVLDAYADNRKVHADEIPLVELARDSYEHAFYGRIFTPMFEIVEWCERPIGIKPIYAPVSQVPIAAAGANGRLIEHERPSTHSADQPATDEPEPGRFPDDLNDEIPFD